METFYSLQCFSLPNSKSHTGESSLSPLQDAQSDTQGHRVSHPKMWFAVRPSLMCSSPKHLHEANDLDPTLPPKDPTSNIFFKPQRQLTDGRTKKVTSSEHLQSFFGYFIPIILMLMPGILQVSSGTLQIYKTAV